LSCPDPWAGSAADTNTRKGKKPYLDRPLIPLALVLPRMLNKIEIELADMKVTPASDHDGVSSATAIMPRCSAQRVRVFSG
jgi:hypothetical protein